MHQKDEEMKEHFCPAEKSTITYQGKCNWCGEKETLAQTQEPPKYSFKAHWEKDGRIGVVAAIVRSDGGVHILEDIIDMPQRTERPVDCERCNRLEEHAYDLVGKLRVANIKLSMQPQRTWVGLSDEEYIHITDSVYHKGHGLVAYYKAIEQALKENNT
jgi:hypothetical protein